MKKYYFFVAVAMATLFTACNNEFLNMGEQNDFEKHAATLKKTPKEIQDITILDFTPEREFFYGLGDLHNECLDYLQEPLSQLPMAYDAYNDTHVLALEIDLLSDFVFQHAVDYLSGVYEFSDEDLAACSWAWDNSIYEINFLDFPEMASSIQLMEFWYLAKGIVYGSMEPTDMADELQELFEWAYDELDGGSMTAQEFGFLSYLTITRSSILYWSDDDNMIAYNEIYKLPEELDLSLAKRSRFWGADGRGAIAGGIGAIASGCWFLVPLVAIISSAVVAINDALRDDLHLVFECQLARAGDRAVMYRDCHEDLRADYQLFDATIVSRNPYITGDYQNLIMPEGIWYD